MATKERMPIDAIRFENYQRTEGTTGYGFSVSAERAVHKRVLLAGGFANIDENNGTHRFDLVLSYNVLKALQKAGAW